MKGTTVLAFAAGGICGALAVWLALPAAPVAGGGSFPSAPKGAPLLSPSRNREAVERLLEVHTGPEDQIIDVQVRGLEQELAAARKEARANLLKGALVLEVGGWPPETLLETWKDLEPERGTVRFSSDPERMAMNPWMTLATIVPEEFEEALARSLDNDLRWVEPLHLAPEEARAIRDFTERAWRYMVEVQQKQTALRRLLADTGRFTPEERKSLEEKYLGLAGLDKRIYDLSYQPAFKVPLLFPPAGGK